MMTYQFLMDPQFWLEEWGRYRQEKSRNNPTPESGKKFWGRLAQLNKKEDEGEQLRQRAERAISCMQRKMPLAKGMKVLDVGAGGGTLAIPLARMGLEVTALDVTPASLDILQEKAEALPITTFCMDWNEVSLEEKEWVKSFDVVIASMTPAVSSKEAFLKLEQACKGMIYYASFTRPHSIHFQDELWPLLLEEDWSQRHYGSFYLFNWLFSREIIPSYEESSNSIYKVENSVDVIEEVEAFYSMFKDLTERDKEIIRQVIENKTIDGKVMRSTEMRTCSMVWSVESV